MRIPSSVFAVGRWALVVGVVAGSVALFSATRKTEFTVHDKAFYADQNTVNFVRPGLVFAIKSANITADGTMSVDYTIADPKGQPLDLAGVLTPGAVSVSFIAAYIPQGQEEFWAYNNGPVTSPITKATATQATTDKGGTSVPAVSGGIGEYVYTFKTKAVAQNGSAFDKTATHRIGIYGSRNLVEFDMGTYYDDAVISWVPAGGTSAPRDVVRTGACNNCHGTGSDSGLAAHGGSRKSVELCDMCHTKQTVDPDTGNNMSMQVFIHKLHMGDDLPSVKAGGKYQIIGHNQSVSDYSTVAFPANGAAASCQSCHDPKQGASQQNAYMTKPNRDACGSCHDDVNFATGANHANLPQVSDNQCSSCHMPTGESEFDTSVTGAHTVANKSAQLAGVNIDIVKVDNGVAGKAPLVTFTAKDNKGNAIPMSSLTGGSNSLRFVLTGPTTDYGATNFGSDVTTPGYVSETANTASKCDAGGTCTYQFTHAIPASAKGTFAVGSESRRTGTLNAGTVNQTTVNYGATNDVFYFSVDGSTVTPRRKVVEIAKCDSCHGYLSLHGANRNDNTDYCVFCHNPYNTDISQRPNAKDPADKAAPAQGINFAYMIHRIHTGEELPALGASYTVVGNGGSHNDFTEVRYPLMSKTGSVGYTQACYTCHVNGSEAVLPIGKNQVTNPQSPLSPAGATTSACTACHPANSTFAHAMSATDTKFGESCDVCHGGTAEFNTTKVHAGQ